MVAQNKVMQIIPRNMGSNLGTEYIKLSFQFNSFNVYLFKGGNVKIVAFLQNLETSL